MHTAFPLLPSGRPSELAALRQRVRHAVAAGPAVVEATLETLTVGEVAAALTALAGDDQTIAATAQHSYLHGNGFFKVVLDASPAHKLRLHVWERANAAQENAHDHRWPLTSRVLAGRLVSDGFTESKAADALLVNKFIYSPEATAAGAYRLRPIGRVRLEHTRTDRAAAGTVYTLRPREIHRIRREPGAGFAATLVVTGAPVAQTTALYTNLPLGGKTTSELMSADSLRQRLLAWQLLLAGAPPIRTTEHQEVA